MRLSFVFVALVSVILIVASADSFAQTTTSPTTFGEAKEIPLYPGVAPGSEKVRSIGENVHGLADCQNPSGAPHLSNGRTRLRQQRWWC